MFVIVGPYPNKENEKDGMVQRVNSIDSLFTSQKRKYLSISVRKNWHKKNYTKENLEVFYVNLFKHFWFIIKTCWCAKLIYVHSIYNALYILWAYIFNKNIVTDMHGVVVEEIKMNQKHNKLLIYSAVFVYTLVEWLVMKYSSLIITVTEEMKNYFSDMYTLNSNKLVVLPIFTNLKKERITKELDNYSLQGIYAGGTQPWQCINIMCKFIEKTSTQFKWTLLSSDSEFFRSYFNDKKLVNYPYINSVPPNRVKEYYDNNYFGIIFREENIVNRVACPTKLIEYLEYGLLPLVLTPHIGDFKRLGYRYLKLEDILQNKLPTLEEALVMIQCNYAVLDLYNEMVANGKNKLIQYVNGC